MNLSMKQRLLLILIAPLVGMGTILIVAFIGLSKISNSLESLFLHPYAVSTTIRSIETNLVSIHRNMKDIALSNSLEEALEVEKKISRAQSLIDDELLFLESRFLGDKKMVDDLRSIITDWSRIQESVISQLKSGDRETATKIIKFEGQEQIQKILQAAALLREFADSNADKFYRNAKIQSLRAKWTLFLSALVTSLISFVVAIYLSYSVSKLVEVESQKLSLNVDRLCEVAKILDTKSSELSDIVSGQSEQFSTVSSATTEIRATTSSTSQKAQNLREFVSELSSFTRQGMSALSELRISLDEIKKTVQSLFAQLEVNATSVSEIETVIKLVDSKASSVTEIVFQTKLLSFNASVEAARAGDAGKGFSVVAEEIGQLASLSGRSADEIKSVVAEATAHVTNAASSIRAGAEQLTTAVNSSLKQSDSSAQQFEKVFETTFSQVENINNLIVDVATASREQTKGVSDVEKAILDLSTMSEITRMNAQQFSDLSKDVSNEILNVELSSQKLSHLVKG